MIMKNKFVKGVPLACLISLIISCNSKQEEPVAAAVDKEQIKKEIQAKEDEFANAYNTGSKDSIGYYADDATSFAQNKAPLVGKKAIVEYLLAALDSNTSSHKISFVTNEVFPSNDGNQVVEIGYYKVVDSANTAVNTGNYIVLFEKRNGKYMCVRDMSTSDMPNQ
jgi:ketosteroid isomerase-like protein